MACLMVAAEKGEPAYMEKSMLEMLEALLRRLGLYDALRGSPAAPYR
jgi:hypothetical protein